MIFVIFDQRLRNATLRIITAEKDKVGKIYRILKFWLDKIFDFAQEDPDLPAKFVSAVFFKGESWDYSLEVRVPAAVIQLLITVMKLPLWINWADMELGEEIIRLIYIFSSGSEVKGIPGQVIVAQLSDDDREVDIEMNGNKMRITTLLGCVALLYTIYVWLYKTIDENKIIKEFNELVKSKIHEALKLK